MNCPWTSVRQLQQHQIPGFKLFAEDVIVGHMWGDKDDEESQKTGVRVIILE